MKKTFKGFVFIDGRPGKGKDTPLDLNTSGFTAFHSSEDDALESEPGFDRAYLRKATLVVEV